MDFYLHIPDKFIRKFAREKKIKLKRGFTRSDIIQLLEKDGFDDQLKYLNDQFRFAGSVSSISIIKHNDQFTDKSNSTENFIKKLTDETWISPDQVGTSWEPPLRADIQICGIEIDGSDVWINMVKERKTTRKTGYRAVLDSYAQFASAVIHFNDEVIEIRCAYSYRDEFAGFIMKMLGMGNVTAWWSMTLVTKDEAKEISKLLSAGLVSTQVAIPSSVGSLRFNSKNKEVDLYKDPVFAAMINAIQDNCGLPTDDTMDETCHFTFIDQITALEIPVSFEINLRNGCLKFLTPVTQSIIEHVLDVFIRVSWVKRQETAAQIAAGNQIS